MKKILTILSLAATAAFSQKAAGQTTIRIYDTVLFYGGYASTSVFQEPAAPGVVRLKTSLFTKKLTPDVLNQIGTTLSMKVYCKAVCDNYDRAGHVTLAFVPKGDTTYSISDTAVKRMEIARFITPFMDRFKVPDTVPYEFSIDNVASILKENKITDMYDIWMELEIFGVAQSGLTGCATRKDVYYGSVDLITNASAPRENDNIIVPVYSQHAFNNYQSYATDTLGTTVKTVSFTLDSASYNTSIYLITSNHGAGNNGEEYNRREHYVYFDGTQVLQYKPGFTTCEPYRIYNTQRNGIYNPQSQANPQGANFLSDAQWQSFSNWCPGAYIPIRTINVGDLTLGTHTFKIRVPDAVFTGGDGNFPLSLYVQGKSVKPITGIHDMHQITANTTLYPNLPETRWLLNQWQRSKE